MSHYTGYTERRCIVKTSYKKISAAVFMLSIFIILAVVYMGLQRLPMQKLKITAVTKAEEFDISGKTDLYYFKSLSPGEIHTAVIKFIAVKNTSEKLFSSYGTGQYVYLGCDELKTEYSFMSIGRFLHIKLTLNASQTDLKLEDGTPFDITRYSLKPVLMIEE